MLVKGVPGVTIRGFQIKSAQSQHCAVITGGVSGLVIEDVRFSQTPEMRWAPLFFTGAVNGPIGVRGCTFRGGQFGLVIDAAPAIQIQIEDNRFLAAETHLFFMGAVKLVDVKGNIFVGGIGVGLNLAAGSGSQGMRISNNTFLDSSYWLTFEGADLPADGIVSDNLVLGAEGVNLAVHPVDDITNALTFRNNWWEPGPKTDEAAAARFAAVHRNVGLLSRDPDDPNFLRPGPDSPLGAGPSFVGAYPPAAAK